MIIFGGKLKLTFACVMHVTRKFHAEMTFNFPCPEQEKSRDFYPFPLEMELEFCIDTDLVM